MPAERLSPPVLAVLAAGVVTLMVLAGAGVPATRGAQVSGDEPQYLLTALSLWEDGDLNIADEIAAERFRDFHRADLFPQTRPLEDGARISPHNPLLPLLLALPMGLGGWVGAKLAMAVLAGALAGVLVWTCLVRMGTARSTALITVGAFALSPPLAVYGTQVYPELPAALAVAVAIAALLPPGRGGQLSPVARGVAMAALVALPWLSVKYVPVAAVLAVTLLWRLPGPARARTAAWLAVAGLIYALVHLWIYGGVTPYATGIHFTEGQLTVIGSNPDLWGRSSRLLGLLVDRGFGLAVWQPAFLLVPLAAAWVITRRAGGAVLLASLAATGWLVATFVALTMHGWWFPGRQLIVVLPALILIVAGWAESQRRRLQAVGILGAVGIVAFGFLTLEGLSGRLTWVIDFGATSNPLVQAFQTVLPDYQSPTSLTWVLHAGWLILVAGLVGLGWWQGRRQQRGHEESATPTLIAERAKEKLTT